MFKKTKKKEEQVSVSFSNETVSRKKSKMIDLSSNSNIQTLTEPIVEEVLEKKQEVQEYEKEEILKSQPIIKEEPTPIEEIPSESIEKELEIEIVETEKVELETAFE